MITLPNLDDQLYDDIIETAKLRARQYFPDWTNFNPSDPGVTLLELFAWLKEMQQYHLNRVTKDGILACLQLLGISPDSAKPARMTAVFHQSEAISLPKGFPITSGTSEGIVFETSSPLSLGEVKIRSVWVDTGEGAADAGGFIGSTEISVQPFGYNECEGACLYIGFTSPVYPEMNLFFEIEDKYPVPRSPFGEDMLPSRDIEWAYGADFAVAETVTDTTRGFSVSGEIHIGLKDEWNASSPLPGMPFCYWMRARLLRKGSEESPKILNIFKDYACLVQQETLAGKLRIADNNIYDYPGLCGEHIVFEKSGDGWKLVEDAYIDKSGDVAAIRGISQDGGEYRVVGVKKGYNPCLSTHTNLPGIRLDPQTEGFITEISLMILENGLWRDWRYMRDLHMAGPMDRVFSLEEDNILFGDNVHGACPPPGTENVIISECRITKGFDGNTSRHTLNAAGSLHPDNPDVAYGGINPETIESAARRAAAFLMTEDRCVTRSDYEAIASATPGTRILRVRAFAGYDAETGNSDVPALVTIVVQPYGISDRPVPDKRLLERVRRHLEKARLLTTCIKVTAPEYVPVSISADISADAEPSLERSLRRSLRELFSPVGGIMDIGGTVKLADIMAVISKYPGVRRLNSVTMNVPENMAAVDRTGNVVLRKHIIAASGTIEIRVRS